MPRERKCSEVKHVMVLIVHLSGGGYFFTCLHFSLFFLFSKLQSDLRTTNLEELKITVESYFEEVTQHSIVCLHEQACWLKKKNNNFVPGVISPLTVSAVSDPAVEDAAGSFREEVCVSLLIQSSLCVCVAVTSSSLASPVSNQC